MKYQIKVVIVKVVSSWCQRGSVVCFPACHLCSVPACKESFCVSPPCRGVGMKPQSRLRRNWLWAAGGAFVTIHLATWLMQRAMKSAVRSEAALKQNAAEDKLDWARSLWVYHTARGGTDGSWWTGTRLTTHRVPIKLNMKSALFLNHLFDLMMTEFFLL